MSEPSSPSPRLRLRVSPAAESALRAGHPWLFSESIRDQNRNGVLGELAVIYDRQNRFLAFGLYDPGSPIRVRILHRGRPETLDTAWWERRLRESLERRAGLFDEQTTAYRAIHGENDGWPGLVVDRYNTAWVLKLYTAAWLPRLQELRALFTSALQPRALVLRLSRNIQDIAREQFRLSEGVLERGGATPAESAPGAHQAGTAALRRQGFLESGLRFEADLLQGQKTGFFLDQRENRRQVETLAAGREVLNAFSFSGGFSLYAARGGARAVTDLDISEHALESSRRNFALNSSNPAVGKCRHDLTQADAFEWLEQKRDKRFDLVILDPPSLARREAERAGAIQAYGRLAMSALRTLRERGILVAASCSAHVSAAEFFAAITQAVRRTGHPFRELARTGHPADHQATFPEAEYLKCLYVALE